MDPQIDHSGVVQGFPKKKRQVACVGNCAGSPYRLNMASHEQIIYFHGMPGGLEELQLFGNSITTSTAEFHVLDRKQPPGLVRKDEHFCRVANAIKEQFPDDPLRLIGFSLGASAALRTAPHLGDQVQHIELVSAAAPLTLGSYLDRMAGAPVFKLAALSPFLFGLLAQLQSITARISPEQFYAMLFATVEGADRALVADLQFRTVMLRMLKQCLWCELPTYRREIDLYIGDWSAELDQVTQPVTIFHGRADNWSPPAMSEDLAQRLGSCKALHLMDDLSHYSTLREFFLRRQRSASCIVSAR